MMLRLYILLVMIIMSHLSLAQNEATDYDKSMNRLLLENNNNYLSNAAYLKKVDSIAADGYGKPGFFKSLQHFRKLAFATAAPNNYKVKYYVHLVRDAAVSEQTGRSIYFIQKQTEEEKKYAPNTKPELTMSAYMLGTYLYYNSFDKADSAFKEIYPQLESIPNLISQNSIKAKSAEYAFKILTFGLSVPGLSKDTALLRRTLALSNLIYSEAQKNNSPDYKKNFPALQYFYYHTLYLIHKNLYPPDISLTANDIQLIRETALSPAFKEVYGETTPYLLSEFYIYMADEYLKAGRPDSTLQYLAFNKALNLDTAIVGNKNSYDLLASVYALKGNHRLAYEYLRTAFNKEKEDVTKIITDRDHNLYAQAEAEDQKLMLEEAIAEKQISDQRISVSLLTIGLLLLAGISIPLYLRQRQKARFLQFKLNMARNIHDETNPALLYAKALAKSTRTADGNNATKSELEQHIEHTIEIIRSLSHDLKSDKQHTIGDLAKDVENTLKKLSLAYQYSYNISYKTLAKTFLSHQQFTQLRSIALECITNTIKHATFDKIDIAFKKENHKLILLYTDNGSGSPVNEQETGIGIANMRERAEQLHGDFELHCNQPNGYRINIAIPLR